MGDLGKDTKELILGVDNSEAEPTDFKSELDKAIKSETITKAEGTILITSRENVDKLGLDIDKKQIKDVKKIKDNEVYDSAEEELEAKKKKEEKKKEQERKRKEREDSVRVQGEKSQKQKSAELEKTKSQKEREN